MTRPGFWLLLAAAAASNGCAALTNPVADGVPIRRLPAEVLGRPKSELRAIPLTVLQQREPDPYRLDEGDVLAIVADNLVSEPGQQPPVNLPDQSSPIAASGFPFPVGENGRLSIPRLPPINVKGLSVAEAEQLVREYATGKRGGEEILKDGKISVQLLRKRRYQVTVVREDSQVPLGGPSTAGTDRRGIGLTVSLQAGENDVLRAINAAGGPPGLSAKNEITVLRNLKGKSLAPQQYADAGSRRQLVQSGEVVQIKIPLRLYPEQPITVREEDIILRTGDLVLIEARDTEYFITAGVAGAAQFPLPRDYDLNVIEAIAQIRGPLLNGGYTQNAFIAQSVNTGIGNPSPSLVTVLRRAPNNRQIPIRVDLNRAFTDPRERLLMQPGDILVLQERPGEAAARYFTQTFRFNTFTNFLRAGDLTGSLTTNNP